MSIGAGWPAKVIAYGFSLRAFYRQSCGRIRLCPGQIAYGFSLRAFYRYAGFQLPKCDGIRSQVTNLVTAVRWNQDLAKQVNPYAIALGSVVNLRIATTMRLFSLL